MDPISLFAVFLGMVLGAGTDLLLAGLAVLLGLAVRRWWIWLLGCVCIGVVDSLIASIVDPIPYDHWGTITFARIAAAFLWGCIARGVIALKRKLTGYQSSSDSA